MEFDPNARLHGVTEAQLLALDDTPNAIKLIASCAHSAWATMLKGSELPATVGRRLGGFTGWQAALELRCVIQGGLRILDKMETLNDATFNRRPALDKGDALLIAWRALIK